MPVDDNRPVPVLSLFSGAGGMDLGFREAGFEPVLAIDNFDAAIRSYNSNLPAVAKHGDISNIDATTINKWLSANSAQPRGVIGGPPCQGFSAGNVVQNTSDRRNRLPYKYARLLKQLSRQHPIEFFVLENVVGLTRPKHARRFALIRRAFETAGFQVYHAVLDAASFGVPQHRRRLFLVGFKKGLKSNTTEFQFPLGGSRSAPTVKQAIGELPPPTFVPAHHESIPNHWTMTPRSKRFSQARFNRYRSFRLLEWDKPSPTVAYGNREIHIHPSGKRRLSIREALTLQGFPMDFELHGTFSDQVTQVSNAVPPPVAKAIADSIASLIMRPK